MTRSSVVVQGDARRLPLPDNSIHAVCCDPPYNLAFMGRKWDTVGGPQAFQAWCETWAREALRVLRPGGWLLAFGSPRTWHRLTCGIEDAGFELRDQEAVFGPLAWLYGSGFPKSRDVGKDIDRMAGAEREVIGQRTDGRYAYEFSSAASRSGGIMGGPAGETSRGQVTAPATPEAARWQGWGSALKPSWEPVVVARKPLAGTLAGSVLAWGTGALNVDGCRIGAVETRTLNSNPGMRGGRFGAGEYESESFTSREVTAGRWPPNVALIHGPDCRPVGVRKVRGTNPPGPDGAHGRIGKHGIYGDAPGQRSDTVYADPDGTETIAAWACQPDCPVRLLDEVSGEASFNPAKTFGMSSPNRIYGQRDSSAVYGYGDRGGASRFMATFPPDHSTSRIYYTAKAPTAERVTVDGDSHATVKPLALMRWLMRLVTPPGGIVLDLFAGSGTTGEAAMLEGFRSVLVDLDMASCRKAMVRTDPLIRRRGAIVTDNQGRLVEESEHTSPRLF